MVGEWEESGFVGDVEVVEAEVFHCPRARGAEELVQIVLEGVNVVCHSYGFIGDVYSSFETCFVSCDSDRAGIAAALHGLNATKSKHKATG